MLTRRQIWRKANTKGYDLFYNYSFLFKKINILNKSNSDADLVIKKNTQNVNFNNPVSVILVPSINDYQEFDIAKDLWYNNGDYRKFYSDAKYNSI
jgi:hypothetical protein